MNKLHKIRQGMNVALVGYGKAGRAVLTYLGQHGVDVSVSDQRLFDKLSTDEKDLLERYSARYEGGGHTIDFLSNAELVVLSPGIAVEQPVIAEIVTSGIPVIGELALAAGKFKSPVIAITGTNGKTTVTELVGDLLRASGKKVFVGGNIGTPVLEYFDCPGEYEVVVLEVSSFQLELAGLFSPDVAVLMNITPDHLDRHKSLERYAAAKMKIFKGDTVEHAIMSGDDRLCRQFKNLSGRERFLFFGNSIDYAACIKGAGITISTPKGTAVYDLSNSSLATVSGVINSAAALLAVRPFGVEYGAALETLRSYTPGDHRLQTIAEIDGVTYIDDSKATNTGAVNIGLEQVGSNVILIAGGKDKGDNYQLLRASVRDSVTHMVLLGETAETMSKDLGDLAPFTYARSLDEAVHLASSLAKRGDTVLLSPACASFDMFSDYKHRGELFTRAVERLMGSEQEQGGSGGTE